MKNKFLYKLKKIYWEIRWMFFPARPKLIKSISKRYHDLDYHIEEFLFAALIEYVDEEGGLLGEIDDLEKNYLKYLNIKNNEQYFCDNWINAENFKCYYDNHYEGYIALRDAYYWGLFGRKDAQKKSVETVNFNKMIICRQWIEKEDDKHLDSIVKYRKWLWT